MDIDCLNLTARERNALKRAGIMTVEQLRTTPDSELLATRGIGELSYWNIVNALYDYQASIIAEKEN